MRCKYCGSANTELKRVYKPDENSDRRIFVYDCNRCDSVSEYMGIPDDEMPAVDEYAHQDEWRNDGRDIGE